MHVAFMILNKVDVQSAWSGGQTVSSSKFYTRHSEAVFVKFFVLFYFLTYVLGKNASIDRPIAECRRA